MTAKYFALLTNVGAAKLANATALGEKLDITAMAVGDANGTDPTPDPAQTKLVHECHRAPLNSLRVDPQNASQVIAEQVLAETVGGWWVREIGLYDTNGDLVAVGSCPPSYKPLMTEGSGREQIIRMILIVSSSDAVELKIDPAVVLATREYVDGAIEAHAKSRNHPDATTSEKGLVQLSSATNSTSETLAATPKAVKAAYDLANGKLSSVPDATLSAKGIVQLSSATDSDSETLAATPKAVKAAYGRPGESGLGVGPQHHADAYSTIGQIYRINGTSVSSPGSGVYGVVSLPCDGGPSTSYLAIQANGIAYVGWSSTPANGVMWTQVFTAKNPPTATQTNALPITGGRMTGEVQSTNPTIWRGIQGDYGAMWHMDVNATYFLLTNKGDQNGNYNGLRPLTINNATGEVTIGTPLSIASTNAIYKAGHFAYSNGGNSYNQTSGMVMQGVGDQVGEMYFLENIGKYAALCFHVKSGGRDAWVEFRNDGDFYINGTSVAPPGIIQAWPSDTPPTGWMFCDGSWFDTGQHPLLARVFPGGQLPDLRGAFLRAKDNGKGVDPNRGVLSIQPGQAPASAIGGGEWGNYAGRDTGHTVGTGSDNTYTYRVMQETEQQRETRPYNVAVNYIVRVA